MFLDILNIIDDFLDGSLLPKVWYKHFLVKNMPKSDAEEIWILYYILNMIHEKRPWSGAFCLNHFLRVLWSRFFFLHLVWSLEIVLKTNGMVIAALKSFVGPLEAKCLKKSLSPWKIQKISKFGVWDGSVTFSNIWFPEALQNFSESYDHAVCFQNNLQTSHMV